MEFFARICSLNLGNVLIVPFTAIVLSGCFFPIDFLQCSHVSLPNGELSLSNPLLCRALTEASPGRLSAVDSFCGMLLYSPPQRYVLLIQVRGALGHDVVALGNDASSIFIQLFVLVEDAA